MTPVSWQANDGLVCPWMTVPGGRFGSACSKPMSSDRSGALSGTSTMSMPSHVPLDGVL
jgi:hypothetical protein